MKITFVCLLFIFVAACNNSDGPLIDIDLNKSDNTETDTVQVEVQEPVEEIVVQQSKEERIAEIKALYGEFQIIERSDENVCEEKTLKYTSDLIVEGMEFENKAKQCQLENDFSYKKVIENGYEWGAETIFYYKNDQLFFVYVSGGSEGWAYDQRVYYDREGEVIRILEDENDHDGEAPTHRKDVTSESRGGEILNDIKGTRESFDKIMK